MPAPTGEGIPQRGDRSARDTLGYPELHASDIEEEEYTYHNPWPMAAGQAAVSDGTQMRPTTVLTPTEHDVRDHSGVPGVGSGSGGRTYRQFTYVPNGAGSWSFVVDDAGMPVFVQLDLED